MINKTIIIISLLLSLSTSTYGEMLVSHKTAGLEFPENSLQGFVESLSMDVDAIEIDVHVTKDKKLILHHDPVLSSYNCFDKTSKQRMIIAQHTMEELLELDCINHKVKKPYKIPTLDTIFTAYKESDQSKKILLEIKVFDLLIHNNPLHKNLDTSIMHFPHDEVAELVYSKIREHGISTNIMFNTFSRELLILLKDLKKNEESFQFGLLYKGDYLPTKMGVFAFILNKICHSACWIPDYEETREWLNKHGIDFLIPNYLQLSSLIFASSFENEILNVDKKFKVIPWTLNKENDWEEYVEYGFAGIITDKPTTYAKWKKTMTQ